MIIKVSRTAVSLVEVDDLTGVDIRCFGPATPTEIDVALCQAGAAYFGGQPHFMSPEWLLQNGEDSPEWRLNSPGIPEFTTERGWTGDGGVIRAHTEN